MRTLFFSIGLVVGIAGCFFFVYLWLASAFLGQSIWSSLKDIIFGFWEDVKEFFFN